MADLTEIAVNADCFDYMSTMPDQSVDFVLSDIPYGECSGRKNGGFVPGLNRDKADKDADGSEFDARRYAQECLRICRGHIVIFCGHKQIGIIREEMEKCPWVQMIRLLVWEKQNVSPMNGQHFYLNSIEQAICCRHKGIDFNGKCKHCVIRHPSQPNPDVHETVKPIGLLQEIIEDCTKPGDIVFDGTAGSFSTAQAAHLLGRGYICVEKNKELFDKAMKFRKEQLAQGVLF